MSSTTASKLHLKDSPTLADIQAYVKEMGQERGFTEQTVAESCILLGEEIGELFKVVRKYHTSMQIDKSKVYELDAAAEIADIIIVLTCIANQMGVDMEAAFRDKEEQNKQRDWEK